MPIKIHADLPARSVLENENIFVMTEQRASQQDIRPLKIAIVNLMPTKIATETQLLRLLGNSPLQVEISLVHMEAHEARNVGREHLDRFYIPSKEVLKSRYDGMIITGAPVEQIPFEEVDYWSELCDIMDFAKKNVFSTLYICWGAQAGLYHHYGVSKYSLPQKLFGVYPFRRTHPAEPLLRGFDDVFPVPQSRHTGVCRDEILAQKELKIIADSEDAGVLLVKSESNREIFMTGHLEYDVGTLSQEYFRDVDKGLPIQIPVNYFPNNDSSRSPCSTWRSTAHLFYSNWLNYCVYQETPFNLTDISGSEST